MKRGPVIVVVFIVIAAIVVGASQFLRSQPAMEITLAVNPLAENWIRGALDSFNATSPLVNGTQRAHFNVQTIDDTTVWGGQSGWSATSHPDAWIPSASVSIEYASAVPLPIQTVNPSLARTPLVWGGFSDRLAVLTAQGAKPFDWPTVQAAAATQDGSWTVLGGDPSWQYLKLAFPQPSQSMSGLTVLFSGAAAFANNPNLRSGVVVGDDFHTWMQPVAAAVPNFTTLGGDVAVTMAARGTSVADIALLPESQWLTNLTPLEKDTANPVRFGYPASQFIFDFPLARWDDTSVTADQRAAVDALSTWLTGAAQQESALVSGLRPAQSEPTASSALFAQGVQYGLQLVPNYGQSVQPPTKSDTQRLLLWFSTAR